MLKTIFKNVGQGDSIIIEWQKDSATKIGIIDCNHYNKINPVLEYLISSKYKEIEFIILSHPHFDHFSGLREVLEYCETKKILVKKFLHTSQQVPAYLRVATKSVIASNELILLFKKIKALRKNGIIEYLTYISDDIRDLTLNNELSLRFLAPSTVEYEQFLNKTPLFDEEEAHNNAQANWLSTIVKVYATDWYIILTSDSTVETLKRVGIKHKPEFSGTTLKLGQSPHHGAKGNHYDGFWKTKTHESKTPIIFSVGDNNYKHPSEKAVKFFSESKNGFKIFSTNQVGSLNTYISTVRGNKISSYLDLAGSEEVPKPISVNQYQGDQTFQF